MKKQNEKVLPRKKIESASVYSKASGELSYLSTKDSDGLFLDIQLVADMLGIDRRIVNQKVRRMGVEYGYETCDYEDEDKKILIAPMAELFDYVAQKIHELRKSRERDKIIIERYNEIIARNKHG